VNTQAVFVGQCHGLGGKAGVVDDVEMTNSVAPSGMARVVPPVNWMLMASSGSSAGRQIFETWPEIAAGPAWYEEILCRRNVHDRAQAAARLGEWATTRSSNTTTCLRCGQPQGGQITRPVPGRSMLWRQLAQAFPGSCGVCARAPSPACGNALCSNAYSISLL
jgi:hypothetical protein